MGPVIVVLVVHHAAEVHTHADKACRQAPGALTFKTYAAVLPVAEALDEIGVLVGDVHAAGVGDVTVDAGDLAVVAVVEVQAVHILVHGVEDEYLDAHLAQTVDRLAGKALDVAEVVENNLDLNPLAHLGAEDLFKLIPELSLSQNEVFKEDEALSLGCAVDEITQQNRALGQVRDRGILIELEVAAAEVVCRARPSGQLARELVDGNLTAHAHALRLVRKALGVLRQMALLRRAAPEEPENHTHRRGQQKQDEPDELIGKLTWFIVDMHRKEQRANLYDAVGQRQILLHKVGDGDNKADLHRKQDDDQHDPQRRRNAPLALLLNLESLHRSLSPLLLAVPCFLISALISFSRSARSSRSEARS